MKQAQNIEALLHERADACDIPAIMKALDSGLVNVVRFLFLNFVLNL